MILIWINIREVGRLCSQLTCVAKALHYGCRADCEDRARTSFYHQQYLTLDLELYETNNQLVPILILCLGKLKPEQNWLTWITNWPEVGGEELLTFFLQFTGERNGVSFCSYLPSISTVKKILPLKKKGWSTWIWNIFKCDWLAGFKEKVVKCLEIYGGTNPGI